ncbi:hypothetical protein [Prevotella sp. P2-180]|uniref:hypothetical protein n=1 Tax=Prevotella sp. P2-180 TaxID=2024224 RepID=UPI000B974AB2|nr:hypothetical protein [Prevotella sp. P2-180]OYP69723.1 hypothetical protein CIK98_00675 [Prevotella sp. P2-180]
MNPFFKLGTMLTIVAGAAMTISSCSSNEIEPMSASDLALAKYEKAFIARFGQPAKDQTWGFGTVDTKSFGFSTRAISSSYTFPSDASSDKFLDDVPEGVEKYVYGKLFSYIDESFSGQSIQIQGTWVDDHTEPGTVYIKGNVDLTNGYFYVAANTTIYLVKGATLKLKADDAKNFQNGCNFYIAEGAKIVTDGDFIPNSCNIYNHGTIEAANVLPNGNSLIYNRGTIKTGKVTLNNADTKLVNDGDLSASELYTAGSSKFQNNGTATISGKTTVNSNDNIWVNNGKYTTATYTYQAGSSEVVNNCSMTVTGEFYFNLGDNAGQNCFRMDGNASCVVGSFKAEGPFYIYMGANALFKVEGTATLDAAKANYGIYGPTSGYAVFQAKDIVKGKDNQGYEVTYGNNLYIVADTHFSQGYSGDYPYIDFKGGCSENNIYTNGKLPSFSIESSECNPGFTGETPDPTPEADVRVIAEDLTVSDEGNDFDFNDVVFDIKFDYPAGKTTIILRAAGGTLPLQVGGVEVHEKFGVPVTTMVNTGGVTKDPVPFELNGTFDKDPNKIKVMVQKDGNWIELEALKGKVASKICVGVDYNWCSERQDIATKYPSFAQWVQNTTPTNWWK